MQVWFMIPNSFKWHFTFDGLGSSLVHQPDNMVDSLCPEVLGEAGTMIHGTGMLEYSLITTFCNAVVLWSVMDGKFNLCTS